MSLEPSGPTQAPEAASGNPAATISPEAVLTELSRVRPVQPVAALQAVDEHRAEFVDALLGAVERGLADPQKSFETDGMLFNYATYFLAKWRDPRAYPLFLRWFSLPGEAALDLGGDTLPQHGARFLASVCGGDIKPIQALIQNPLVNEACRGQAVKALAVAMAWGERLRGEIENYFEFLAREGLERKASLVWDVLAITCARCEFLAVFPELRRAFQDGLIEPKRVAPEVLDRVEKEPRGTLTTAFAQAEAPITDVVAETRWWGGFQNSDLSAHGEGDRVVGNPGMTYVAPAKIGRNDLCPCGSGKKFKKCCGA